MARRTPQQPRAIVGAARRIDLKRNTKAKARTAAEWQSEAWTYNDAIPEVKELILWRGAQLAKLKLFIAALPPGAGPDAQPIPARDPESGIPSDVVDTAERELARVRSQIGGQSEILRRFEMNLEVAGEGYVVGLAARIVDADDKPTATGPEAERALDDGERLEPEDWCFASIDEVASKSTTAGTVWSLKRGPADDKGRTLDADHDTIFRVWQPHPRYFDEPDCALRGNLDVCEILGLLTNQVKAEARSRAGAGILILPNTLSFGPPDQTTPEDGQEAGTDPFVQKLGEALTAPVLNPGDSGSIVPTILRGPKEDLGSDVLRHLDLSRQSDEDLDKRIESNVERLSRGLEAPPEQIMGHANCVDTETEILTERGWLRFDQVRPGDEALTLNHDSGLAEWQTVEQVSRFDVVDLPMVALEGRSHSSLSTEDHRWPVITQRGRRRWRESRTLNTNCRLVSAAACADLPLEPKVRDEFVELVAWWWTEGSDIHDGARIYQSEIANPQHVASIRRALTALVGPPSASMHTASRASGSGTCSFAGCGWPVNAKGLCRQHRELQRAGKPLRPVPRTATAVFEEDRRFPTWRESVGANGLVTFHLNKVLADELRAEAPQRIVSTGFIRSLTRAQLELFIQTSANGDGYHLQAGSLSLHQNEEARSDAFALACTLSGRAVRMWTSRSHGFAESVRYNVQTRRSAPMRVGFGIQASQQTYSGVVWCPTVANGTWFARRRSSTYFTGNTTFANAAAIDEATFDDYLEPRAVFMADAFTVGWIRPRLGDLGTQAEIVSRVFVWYDASALLTAPDQAEHADNAYDRFVISDAAYRRAMHFDEADAPTTEERLVRMALRRGILTSKATNILLELLEGSPDLPDPTPAEEADPAAASVRSGDRQRFMDLAAEAGLTEEQTEALIASLAQPTTGTNPGYDLVAIDRELRTRLLVASNDAMTRALERAGAKLRSSNRITRGTLANVAPILAASTLGRDAVLAAGIDDGDLLSGAFDALEAQFKTWAGSAQTQAINVVNKIVGGFTTAQRDRMGLRLAESIDEAWTWMKGALLSLATAKLYDPNPTAPAMGEFDPSLRVPPGLVRQAVARAGGAAGLTTNGEGGAWIALSDGGTAPAGGIATGEVVQDVLRENGAGIEGYVWDYGVAHRSRPFEPHLELAGQPFENFDDAVLVNSTGWPDAFCMPGDHAGCNCDAVPIVLAPGE